MKRLLSVVFVVMLFQVTVFAVPTAVDVTESEIQSPAILSAEKEIVESGTCGDNLTWTLDSEGTLTISGEGEMWDWTSSLNAPWYLSREEINNVVISTGVTSIGEHAFFNCYKLKSIEIPNGATSMGGYAFYACDSLTSVKFPDSVTSIGERAFAYCTDLATVDFGGGVTNIELMLFYNCLNLKSIEIPNVVVNIGDSAFECSGIESITIPDSVTIMGDYAFSSCENLVSVQLPNGMTSIGRGAFSGCNSLGKITIGNKLRNIGLRAFSGCTSLEKATILSENVKFEESHVFYNCLNLTIHGYTGSTSETYASENNIPFVSLGEIPPQTPGELNGDGVIDMNDAILLLQYSMFPELYPIEYAGSVDFTGDGNVDMNDAILLLQHSMFPELYPIA